MIWLLSVSFIWYYTAG